MKEEKIKVYPCEDCPKFGNHCHFKGRMYFMPEHQPFLRFQKFEGIGKISIPKKTGKPVNNN